MGGQALQLAIEAEPLRRPRLFCAAGGQGEGADQARQIEEISAKELPLGCQF